MPEEEAQGDPPVGKVNIEITGDSVSYDTNLPIPEMMFWLEIVRQQVFRSITNGDPE